MAVGDVINDVQNADITFQPAAGVEVMITSYGSIHDGDNCVILINGANSSYNNLNTSYTSNYYQPKVFINNTNYLKIDGNTLVRSYSGIQIK